MRSCISGNSPLSKCSAVRRCSKPEFRFDLEAFAQSFFFVAGDALYPEASDSRHFKQCAHVLAVGSIQQSSAVVATVGFCVFPIMEIATLFAKLRFNQPTLHTPRWQDTSSHAVFPALVVNHIARSKLSQAEEAGAVNYMHVFARRHQRPEW